MAAPKGNKFSPGRPVGKPNQHTAAVREVIARFADEMAPSFCDWVKETAANGSPEKAADLYLKAIEYHIPKLARNTIGGDPDAPLVVHHKIDDKQILERYINSVTNQGK